MHPHQLPSVSNPRSTTTSLCYQSLTWPAGAGVLGLRGEALADQDLTLRRVTQALARVSMAVG